MKTMRKPSKYDVPDAIMLIWLLIAALVMMKYFKPWPALVGTLICMCAAFSVIGGIKK